MKKFSKKFEDIMSAAAFAEAGEFDTARQMLKKQKVLLVLTGADSDKKAFKYALNISKRIETGLEILYVSTKDVEGLPKEFEEKLTKEAIEFNVVKRSGCIKEEIIDYIGKRRDIQFVVVESSSTLDIDCGQEDRKLSGVWKRLRCPLVLVSELESA